MTNDTIRQPYKFVKHEVPTLEDIFARYKQAANWKKLAEGVELTPEDKASVSPQEGYFKLRGWVFPCSQFMRRFWYRVTFDGGNYDMGQLWAFDLEGAYRAAPQPYYEDDEEDLDDEYDLILLDVTDMYNKFEEER